MNRKPHAGYSHITPEMVREAFDYCPETGSLVWKARVAASARDKAFNTMFAGREAGNIHRSKCGVIYRRIKWRRTNVYAHYLAWLHYHGVPPQRTLDHKDGEGRNNAIHNLREATVTENSMNQKLYRSNTSGICGVSRVRKRNLWKASITKSNIVEVLGHFEDFFEAICARKSAERRLGFSLRHGIAI